MSNTVAGLPLQRKVALTLLLTITAFAGVSYVILSEVVAPAFEELEYEAARTAPPQGFPHLPDIPAGRYTDQRFFDLELAHIWRKS